MYSLYLVECKLVELTNHNILYLNWLGIFFFDQRFALPESLPVCHNKDNFYEQNLNPELRKKH